MFVGKCFAIFISGICLMLMSMTEDIKREIRTINKNLRTKKTRCRIEKQFFELIQFYSKARQLSINTISKTIFHFSFILSPLFFRLAHKFSDLMVFIFVLLFSWSIAAICNMTLLIKLEMVKCLSSHNFIDIVLLMLDFLDLNSKMEIILP